jgi:hypothetical protein
VQKRIRIEPLIGRKIVDIRSATPQELASFGFEEDLSGPCTVIVLDNGTKIFPSRDGEGNGYGVLFGEYKGVQFYVHDIVREEK